MMQVVTGQEMRSVEKQAQETLGLSPLVMMENAGSRIVEVLEAEYGCLQNKRVHILVGTGNNGGDGLVVARQLLAKSARPKVYLVGKSQRLTKENRTNLEILRRLGLDLVQVEAGQMSKLKFSLGMADLIIDAILGTGFKGPLSPELENLVNVVNEIQRPLVAVDVPTGVDASTGRVESTALRADLTINLGIHKVGSLLYPGRAYAGKNVLVDLGFPLQNGDNPSRYLLSPEILELLPVREPWGHKGTFGHTLVVGGSHSFGGAASLCGHAVLRGGGGVATVAVPRSIYSRFQPDELIVVPVAETDLGSFGEASLPQLLELTEGKDVLVLGPGLSNEPEVTTVVQKLLGTWSNPAVIDADALLALSSDFLESVPLAKRQRWVLTPHPGEMARLIGSDSKYVNSARLDVGMDFAKKWGVIIVLKGAPTIISSSEKTYINSTGNHGLATAGTGDVLAGLIGALLAQGVEPLQAGALGAYVHGAAGDLAGCKGQRGLLASDCLNKLQEVLS